MSLSSWPLLTPSLRTADSMWVYSTRSNSSSRPPTTYLNAGSCTFDSTWELGDMPRFIACRFQPASALSSAPNTLLVSSRAKSPASIPAKQTDTSDGVIRGREASPPTAEVRQALAWKAMNQVARVVYARSPPSTFIGWPVTNEAASEQSHTTASAISSGFPSRPIFCSAVNFWTRSGLSAV